MTRFVVDCGAVLHLVGEGIQVPHEAVHRGELPRDVAPDRLAGIVPRATIQALQTT